ncbi:MAG: GIY-YIG nuclease family protein [Planctomycetaceae bacterium]
MKIMIECGNCKKRLTVDPKFAGRRLKCPKCEAKVKVPATEDKSAQESSKDDGVSRKDSELWSVATDKRKAGNLTRGQIRIALAENSIPADAYLKPEDGTADWQQLSVCAEFNEDAEQSDSRYCRECSARICVPPSFHSAKPRCPECGTRTEFINFLQAERPPIDNVPVEPWGKYDFIVVTMTGVLVLLSIISLVALMTSPFLAVLLNFAFFSGGTYLFAITYQHRSDSSRYRSRLQQTENLLAERSDSLRRITRNYNTLQRDLTEIKQQLEDETRSRCEELMGRTHQLLKDAEEDRDTVNRVAKRYLDEQLKWWTQKLRGDNYQIQKGRIEKAIQFIEKEAYILPEQMKKDIFGQLKRDYELRVRKEAEMERQRSLNQQMRAEQKAIKEAEEARKRAAAEQKAIQEALNAALSKAGAEHSAEVEELQRQLREAEERGQRAIAQAQLTKAGHVYVISNIGSFGADVFKVGLTRRLEPLDRVKELGDASVPFPFDVHMMIFSEDAPALEHALHKALSRFRVNRVNFRKEYFRVALETIHQSVLELHGNVEYIADAEALEYHRTMEMPEEEFADMEQMADAQGIDYESDEEDVD